MKQRSLFLLFLLGASSVSLSAQVIELSIDPTSSCNYDGSVVTDGPVYGFESSQEAETAVQDILRQVGLLPNFKIKAANVPNALACVKNGDRFILYSQQFMNDLHNRTGDYWSKVAVLAHEIAHHLQGHTLKNDGSRPLLELEADQWSGFVLCKMGATLQQTQAAVYALPDIRGSSTHPPREARLEAIAVGFNQCVEPKPASTPRSTDNDTRKEIAEERLKRAFSDFIRHWSNKSLYPMSAMLDDQFYYTDQITPFQSRADYVKEKEALFKKHTWIEINTSRIGYVFLDNDYQRGIVTYYQHYNTPTYESWGINKLYFEGRNGEYFVTKEEFDRERYRSK